MKGNRSTEVVVDMFWIKILELPKKSPQLHHCNEGLAASMKGTVLHALLVFEHDSGPSIGLLKLFFVVVRWSARCRLGSVGAQRD